MLKNGVKPQCTFLPCTELSMKNCYDCCELPVHYLIDVASRLQMMVNCLWTAVTCARVFRGSLFAQWSIVLSPCFHQNTMRVSTEPINLSSCLCLECRGGLMVVNSSPHRAIRVRALAGDIVLCSWARHFTLSVPLSIQVYKWVPANLMLGGNPTMD